MLPDCSAPWMALVMAEASWASKLVVVEPGVLEALEEAPLAWLAPATEADELLDCEGSLGKVLVEVVIGTTDAADAGHETSSSVGNRQASNAKRLELYPRIAAIPDMPACSYGGGRTLTITRNKQHILPERYRSTRRRRRDECLF